MPTRSPLRDPEPFVLPLKVGSEANLREHHMVKHRRKKEQQALFQFAAFGRKFGMIVAAGAALVAVLGGVGGALIWLTQHLKP